MPATYTLIASNTLTTSAASVTFSAIPNTYTDLVIRATMKADNTNTVTMGGWLKINSTGSNLYSTTRIGTISNSNPPYSDRSTNANEIFPILMPSSNAIFANAFNSTEFYIPNYTVSQNKPISFYSVAEMNDTTGYDLMLGGAGLWRSTNAITSLGVFPISGTNFVSGSSFFLYGISSS